MTAPGYWMHETTGVLAPAVHAYLSAEPMTGEQIAALRAYLRQWIFAPVWRGDGIDELRSLIGTLTTRRAIEDWLDDAVALGINPL